MSALPDSRSGISLSPPLAVVMATSRPCFLKMPFEIATYFGA
jgi:hypothetical protein